ncbi:hypothetical protein CHH28_03830 [Bacterioplanes sanyensis]|uniref:Uncharacterized protein n=2 Tax=Bacterioplanes sanyensis TaxID=1249553 RepID=A0A222FFK3_9GAMM|nr:hypothetical protein CHH28_03830 [Bacterioplanes sanyensis]
MKDIEMDLPNRSDSQDQFTDKANRFFASLPEWQQSLSNFGGWIQSTAQQTSDLRDEVEQFKENSELQVDLAKVEVQNCQAEVEGAKQQADRSLSEADRAQQQADRAQMHQQSAEVAAAAAGSAPGLPTLTGKANQVLTVNSAGDGVHWRQSGRVGDILETAGSPPPGYLPMNGGEYRAADYPELAQLMPTVWWEKVESFDTPVNSDLNTTVYLGENCWLCYRNGYTDRPAFYSNNNGKSWQRLDHIFPQLQGVNIYDLNANPKSGIVVFRAQGGGFSNNQLQRTNLNFENITKVFSASSNAGGFLRCSPNALTPEWVWVNTNSVHYASRDDGISWEQPSRFSHSSNKDFAPTTSGWLISSTAGAACISSLFQTNESCIYRDYIYNHRPNFLSDYYTDESYVYQNGNSLPIFRGNAETGFCSVPKGDYNMYNAFLGTAGIILASHSYGIMVYHHEREIRLLNDGPPLSFGEYNTSFNPEDETVVVCNGSSIFRIGPDLDRKLFIPRRHSDVGGIYIKALS